jgi:hypothetical protein
MLSINPMNDHQQSFGMAYGFQKLHVESTSKAIAREIEESVNPDHTQKYFTENLVKPLKELKTEVVAECDKVFVTHPISGQRYEMLDVRPWAPEKSYGREINYRVKKLTDGEIGGEEEVISTWHKDPQHGIGSLAWDANYLYTTPIMRKHIAALEIAREFDKQAAAKAAQEAMEAAKKQATEQTAKFLQDLVG